MKTQVSKQFGRIIPLLLIIMMLVTMLPTTAFADEAEKNLEIACDSYTNFVNNQDAEFQLSVTNKGETQTAYLINALYDKQSDKMVSYNYIKKTIGKDETLNWGSLIPIPEQGEYKVKAFAWDSMESPVLISNIEEVTMGEVISPQEDISYEVALQAVNRYVKNKTTDPTVSSIGGEWAVFGLARNNSKVNNNYYENYYAKVATKVEEESVKISRRWDDKVTDVERVIIALSAIGKDASNVNGINLYDYIWNKEANFPGMKGDNTLGGRQGANELIFGLLAVDARNVQEPENATITREEIIDKLINNYQKEDGAFSLSGKEGDIDIDLTAMAVQALSKYYKNNSTAKTAVDKAVNKLSTVQSLNGGYSGGIAGAETQSSEALSQVVVALSIMGIDANSDTRFIKNKNSAIDELIAYYDANEGGFKHSLKGNIDPMSSEQALYALVAYDRFINGSTKLYDMSDVQMSTEEETQLTADEVVKQITENAAFTEATGYSKKLVTQNQEYDPEFVKKVSEHQKEFNDMDSVRGQLLDLFGKTTTQSKLSALLKDMEATLTAFQSVVNTAEKEPVGKVKISVEKRTIGKGDLVPMEEVDLYKGDTVWNVFKRVLDDKNIEFNYSENSQYKSVYISSIAGDGEFDHGSGSGWSFTVNDEFAEFGASLVNLNDGDVIRWRYCLDPGFAELKIPLVELLKTKIEELEDLDITKYTDESAANLNATIANAKAVSGDEQYNSKDTDKELVVSTEIGNLMVAESALVKKTITPSVDGVPGDFENDIWLNKYFHKMKVGTTYDITAQRVEEIIDNPISNHVTLPNFNYEIISGDSVTLNDKTVTAVKEGISVIKISYDEKAANGKAYGACSPVNYGYMIVDVMITEPTASSITTSIKERPAFDTIYFTEGSSTPYEFTVDSQEGAVIKVTCNDKNVVKTDGKYIANLENRSNVIIISATKDGKTENLGYVIDARKIEINIKNASRPGEPIGVNDEVKVSFKGIVMPVYKLAKIYNPCYTASMFGETSTAAAICYNNDKIGKVYGRCKQWDLATKNTINLKFTEKGIYIFKSGKIDEMWWGSMLGAHMDAVKPGEPNFNAHILKDLFSTLPDFTIVVGDEVIVPVESVSLSNTDITVEVVDKTQKLTATINPVIATNKNINWTSSNESIVTVSQDGKVTPVSVGEAIITVKSQANKTKFATCQVKVISELPATLEEKKGLNDKIAEAENIEKLDACKAEWNELQNVIVESKAIAEDENILLDKVNEQLVILNQEIKKYNEAKQFVYTVETKAVENGTEITINFSHMVIPKDHNGVTSWETIYSTNVEGMTEVKSGNKKDAKEDLKTLTFVVPKEFIGTLKLTNGYIKEAYNEWPQFPNWGSEENHFEGQMPKITIEI